MGKSSGMPPVDLVNIAIQSLGLSDVTDFNPSDKVLGMPKIDGELANRVTFDLVDENQIPILVPPSSQWVHILPNEGIVSVDN